METDSDLIGVAVGQGSLVDTVFPAVEGEDPRSVDALYDRIRPPDAGLRMTLHG